MKPTDQETSKLVRSWQRAHGLEPDGIFGPKTRESLFASEGMSSVMSAIIAHARVDIGQHEIGKNGGKYVRGLRELCGFPVDADGAWCAIFVSAMLHMSTAPNTPCRLSRGAYRMGKNIAECNSGRYISDPGPGFGIWKRKGWERNRSAHIRIILSYDAATETIWYIAGNERGRVRYAGMQRKQWERDLLFFCTLDDV